jgi:phage terminase small subunit
MTEPNRARRGLTHRQQTFVSEYVVDLNATQAAKRAGYSAHSARHTGSRNLSIPKIASAIAEAQAKRLEAVDITAEEVLRELAAIARANMLDYMRLDKDGELTVDFSRLDRIRAAALSAVTVEDVFDGGENKRKVRRVKFRTHGKIGALDRLARHYGLLRERVSPEYPDVPAPEPEHDPRQVARAVLLLLREGAIAAERDGPLPDEDEEE